VLSAVGLGAGRSSSRSVCMRPSRGTPVRFAGWNAIPRLQVIDPDLDSPSAVAEAVVRTGAVALSCESEHLMEIAFDHGIQGRSNDFRLPLPLAFRWCVEFGFDLTFPPP
jgi:hypothetical protein